MDMEQMNMVFFTSTKTLLWTKSFAPETTGQYAGVCIFLIAFATILRMLLAIRVNFYVIRDGVRRRRTKGLLAEYRISELGPRPWRANEAMMLGAIDVGIAGVSYLLMLAVMTMNVGYFLSILAGRHLSRSSLIILNREPPGCVETRPAAIERIKRAEPKLKEYKEVLEAAERKLRNNDSGATTIADLLLSDAASVFQGLVRYQGRQLFVNNQWVEAYLKLIRGHFEPNASTSP
ncbi:hypothetical protein FOC4_g10005883 [Fusarium odoratissimum]|uniref:Copper transport protein n=2 Tax=Fusarium oxysporum species complex TaxID=171631 RepID=N1RPQ8_FUSC4|nr:hypothetical protein FOC4_g10005883 [Fusarium odoratissimum]